MNNRLFGLIGAVGVIVLAASTQGLAQDYTLKFGTATFNDDQHKYIEIFKEELESRTDQIEVEIYPQGQLGPMPRQIEGLQTGTQEGFIAPADFFVGVDSRFGVFSAPVIFKNKEHAAKVVAEPAIQDTLKEMAEAKGMKFLGVFAYGNHDYLSTDAIETLEDFEGKKIRVNATDMEREAMARVGAVGVPMPLGEVLPAIQQGVIDGTRSVITIFIAFKYWDVADTLTIINDTMVVSVAMASKSWFDSLPAELQTAVLESGDAAQKKWQAESFEFHKDLRQVWMDNGGKIIEFPEDDRQEMISRLESIGLDATEDDEQARAFYNTIKEIGEKY